MAPPDVCGTYNYQSPANFTENQGLARIDFHQSDKNTIFGRYFITNWVQPPGCPNLPASQGGLLIAAIDGQSDRVQSLTLGDTYVFSPNWVNNVHVTGNRSVNLTDQNSTVNMADLFTAAGINLGHGQPLSIGPAEIPEIHAGFQRSGRFLRVPRLDAQSSSRMTRSNFPTMSRLRAALTRSRLARTSST